MDIKNIKELAQIIALCRKKGIESVKIGENCIEFKLGALAPAKPRGKDKEIIEEAVADHQAYTAEQILNWSAPSFEFSSEGN